MSLVLNPVSKAWEGRLEVPQECEGHAVGSGAQTGACGKELAGE